MLISNDDININDDKYLLTATFYCGVNYWYTGTEQFML